MTTGRINQVTGARRAAPGLPRAAPALRPHPGPRLAGRRDHRRVAPLLFPSSSPESLRRPPAGRRGGLDASLRRRRASRHSAARGQQRPSSTLVAPSTHLAPGRPSARTSPSRGENRRQGHNWRAPESTGKVDARRFRDSEPAASSSKQARCSPPGRQRDALSSDDALAERENKRPSPWGATNPPTATGGPRDSTDISSALPNSTPLQRRDRATAPGDSQRQRAARTRATESTSFPGGIGGLHSGRVRL